MMVSHLARATLPDTGENATSAATETADTLPRRNQGDQEEQPPSARYSVRLVVQRRTRVSAGGGDNAKEAAKSQRGSAPSNARPERRPRGEAEMEGGGKSEKRARERTSPVKSMTCAL